MAGRLFWKKKRRMAGFLAVLLFCGMGNFSVLAENAQENTQESVQKETASTVSEETEQENTQADSMQETVLPDNGEKTETVKSIDVSMVSTEKEISDIAVNRFTFTEEEQVYTLKVKEKGGLYLALAQADSISFESLKLQIYADASMTDLIGKDYIVNSGSKVVDTRIWYLKKAGTYYLKFTYQGEEAKEFAMTAAFLSSADRTLKEGKTAVAYADQEKRAVYYKISVKKKGLFSFRAVPEDGVSLLEGEFLLCDQEKDPVSVKEYVSGSKDNNKAVHSYYMVKKGTYYMKAKLNAAYIASFTLEKVKDQSGKSLAEARKIVRRGKEKTGFLFSDDSVEEEKWYRLRLRKNQNFSIIMNNCINGYLNISVCTSSGVPVKTGSLNVYTGTKILKTSSKWQKGIYYIKISKDKKSPDSSGYFSIQVKK